MRRQIHYSSRMRPRMVLRPQVKTRNKLSRNVVIGGSLLLLNAAFVFSYFYFGKTENAYGAGMSATQNGYWSSSLTWSSGRIPSDNDTLTIPSGKTIVVTDQTPEYLNMRIIVYGTLHINGGKKLNMCNGIIDIMPGGEIEGDNTGSMVDMCANHVWNGSMPGAGPMQISGTTILPVDLAYFKAEGATNGTVNVSWETASEVNCDYFSVERSLDGSNFEALSQVRGAGNTSTSHQYTYVDDNPHSPVSYYRLKQVDFDGKFEIFKVVSINLSLAHDIVVYPNPLATGESATVQIPAGGEKTLQVTVMDANGKQIFSQTLEKENASENVIHFVTEKFSKSGTYFITAFGQSNKYLKKIVVL